MGHKNLRRATRQRKQTNFYTREIKAPKSQDVRLNPLSPRPVNVIEVVNHPQKTPFSKENGRLKPSPSSAFSKKTHFFLAIFFILSLLPTISPQTITTCNCLYHIG